MNKRSGWEGDEVNKLTGSILFGHRIIWGNSKIQQELGQLGRRVTVRLLQESLDGQQELWLQALWEMINQVCAETARSEMQMSRNSRERDVGRVVVRLACEIRLWSGVRNILGKDIEILENSTLKFSDDIDRYILMSTQRKSMSYTKHNWAFMMHKFPSHSMAGLSFAFRVK